METGVSLQHKTFTYLLVSSLTVFMFFIQWCLICLPPGNFFFTDIQVKPENSKTSFTAYLNNPLKVVFLYSIGI